MAGNVDNARGARAAELVLRKRHNRLRDRAWAGTAVALLVLAAGAVGLALPAGVPDAPAREIILEVPGIPGPYCAYGVEKRLLEMPGVTQVKTLWDTAQIRIVTSHRTPIGVDDIRRAVDRADYPYKYEIRMGE